MCGPQLINMLTNNKFCDNMVPEGFLRVCPQSPQSSQAVLESQILSEDTSHYFRASFSGIFAFNHVGQTIHLQRIIH